MTWKLVESPSISPEAVYEILKHHRLLPASVELAAASCNMMASGGVHFMVLDGEDTVANVFVSGLIPGESAQMDLIPVASYFRTGFDEPFRTAMEPLLAKLFGELLVRRITSMFPASRARTKRALCSIGFKPEGRIRHGVALYNREPEDLRVLGLVSAEYVMANQMAETIEQ